MIEYQGKYTNAHIMIDSIEEECMTQITHMCNHEAFTNPIVIMPDTHSGKGSVIGFTMKVPDKVISNVVGVDISCGMISINIGNININHKDLDNKIRERIPFGTNINKKGKARLDKDFQEVCKRVGADFDYVVRSVSTLGGGNHFLEVGRSQNTDDIWITIHTGSRNFGKRVCEYWQKISSMKDLPDRKEYLNKIKTVYPKKEWEDRIKEFNQKVKNIRQNELDFLTGNNKDGYLRDMKFCQEYASLNRKTIMEDILNILGKPEIKDKIETIHNYIDLEDGIIRKGAIRSYIGERMIIPFNMRDGILICEGKSNPEWNFSAPHGAGRVLSRSKAKETLSLEKFEKDMVGIYSTSIGKGTIDESPDAYKDSKIIEEAIEPTAKILDKIIPIHNMKDIDERSWKKK